MGRDLTDRTNYDEIGLGRNLQEKEPSPQEGDMVSIELKPGFELVSDIYWGRHKIGKIKGQEPPGQEPNFVYGLVRLISKTEMEVDCFVTGYRNVNERPKTDEKALGVYVPREAISQCSVVRSFKKS